MHFRALLIMTHCTYMLCLTIIDQLLAEEIGFQIRCLHLGPPPPSIHHYLGLTVSYDSIFHSLHFTHRHPRKLPSQTITMTRQFFVGGNFKLNPITLESKKSLISGLNKAELDPSTGAYNATPFF